MKRWWFKPLLIISVLTVLWGYAGVHTSQSVHAQETPQVSPKTSTQASPPASNQSGEALLADLLKALVATNVTLIMALGSGFAWVFMQYKEVLKDYKEQLGISKDNELNKQKLIFDQQLATEQAKVRDLSHELESLKKENKQHIENTKFQIGQYFSGLDSVLQPIGQKILNKKINLNEKHALLRKKIEEFKKRKQGLIVDSPKDSKDENHQLHDIQHDIQEDQEYQFQNEKSEIEKTLEILTMTLRFIPTLRKHQEIIRDLLVNAVMPPDEQKISDEDILRRIEEGCQNVKKGEEKETLENTYANDTRKFVFMQRR